MELNQIQVSQGARRLQWVDVMKGLGIIAVVAGHVADARFVYVFHMPLFFIISGFLMKQGQYSDREMLRHNAWRLLLPYFVFLAIFYVPELLHALRKGNDIPGLELLYGGTELQGRLTVFWFVTVLFMASWVFNFMLNRGLTAPLLFVGLLGAGMLAGYWRLDLPWAAHVVPVAVFYLWVGNLSARFFEKLESMFSGATVRAAAIVAATLCFGAALMWPEELAMDMKWGNYGMPVVTVAMSVLLTYAIAALSMWLCRVRRVGAALALTGEASMLIMFLHMAVHRTMHTLPWVFTIFPAILIPLLLYIVVRRYPLTSLLFLGQRKRPASPEASEK